MREGELVAPGTRRVRCLVEQAQECAAQCALNALAAASTVCDLDEVARVVKLVGYVASAPGFIAQPAIIDGASEVLVTRVRRERAATRARPWAWRSSRWDAPVEVSLVLELRCRSLWTAA